MSSLRVFEIWISGLHVDSVYYKADEYPVGDWSAEDVRRNLIDHDGYPHDIEVKECGPSQLGSHEALP